MPSLIPNQSPPPKPLSPGAIAIKKFRSAGDVGDIIFQLPAVKKLVGPHGKAIFYIEAAPYTRVRMERQNWRGLDRILKAQDYISDVLPWQGQSVDICLNDFRAVMQRALRQNQGRDVHISVWVSRAHRISENLHDEPWLTIEPVKVAPVVINRTGPGRPPHLVYHGKNFPWRRVVEKYHDNMVFIGSPLEHEVFQAVFGDVKYYPTPSLYEAAQVIAGCSLFIGGQSAPHAIAQGLGKPIILEVWHNGPNCLSTRQNVTNVWDHNVTLLEIENL